MSRDGMILFMPYGCIRFSQRSSGTNRWFLVSPRTASYFGGFLVPSALKRADGQIYSDPMDKKLAKMDKLCLSDQRQTFEVYRLSRNFLFCMPLKINRFIWHKMQPD